MDPPFDVYLIDGRFRVACAAWAMLHNPNGIVIIHDYQKTRVYSAIEEVATVAKRTEQMASLRRKAGISDDQLQHFYDKWKYSPELKPGVWNPELQRG